MTFLTGERIPFPIDNKNWKINVDTFNKGAYILDNLNQKKLILNNPKLKSEITVLFSDFMYVTLWSVGSSQEFVCIEPWYALPDNKNTNHNFEEKPGNVKLESGNSFSAIQEFVFKSFN